MRDFITVDREITAIKMRRSAFTGTFLLVEGTSDLCTGQKKQVDLQSAI